ncbi:MAG: hypothetical protein RMM58_10245 [Chloroflexota bacterium]|nr:hypothetical protein [Dehalococcoidia bacterium]MDW8254245.1 hypothetical protein [Chloroflexota bacterium]
MKVRADIKCHVCGFVSGEVIGFAPNGLTSPRHARIIDERILPSALAPAGWPTPGQPLRCARCNGAVYLDEVEVLRERPAAEPVAAFRPRPDRAVRRAA